VSAAEAKELCSDPQAVARASGADDLLQACQADSLSAILGPTVLQVALTARPREFEPPRRTLDEALEELCNALADDPEGEVAIVFGPERSGLANEDLLRCNRVCGLEVNPSFSSLNLSQAAQIVAYLLRQAVVRRLDLPSRLPKTNGQGRPTAVAANAAGIEALHTAFTDLAIQTGYLDPKQPGRFDERLRALWARAGLQRDELQMLHGLLAAIKKQC
jgi:tRNA/rRNA methyltransferase